MDHNTNNVLKYDNKNVHGKNSNRRLRSSKLIPAVIYSKGSFIKHIIIKETEIIKKRIFVNMPIRLISNNDSSSTSILAVVKDLQIDIIKRNVIHVDFIKVEEAQTLVLNIPFFFNNEDKYKGSTGMNIVNKYLSIECKIGNIPRFIYVDMMLLPQQKKLLLIKDIEKFVNSNITIKNKKDDIVSILK